jgi:hypothetical protein
VKARISNVSIVIPTFNCAPFVAEAIESALGQTLPPREVIVVDDGSDDRTEQVIARFNNEIVFLKQPNRGVAVARNRGLDLAQSDWVMFLDADDRLAPDAVEKLTAQAGDSLNCVVYGERTIISESGQVVDDAQVRDCTGPIPAAARASFGGAAFEPGAAIVPRWLARDVGGFVQEFAPCEDRLFWIQCGTVVEFLNIPDRVFFYRKREHSHSSNRFSQVVQSVRVRIEALKWCQERNVGLFEDGPTPADVLAKVLEQVFWTGESRIFESLLEIAEQEGFQHATIDELRARRRTPEWMTRCKHWLDRILG